MHQSISRRRLLKATAATATATAIGSRLHTGVAAAPGKAPAHISRLSQSSGMNLTLAIQSFAHEALQPVLDEWGESTGNTVTLESGPVRR